MTVNFDQEEPSSWDPAEMLLVAVGLFGAVRRHHLLPPRNTLVLPQPRGKPRIITAIKSTSMIGSRISLKTLASSPGTSYRRCASSHQRRLDLGLLNARWRALDQFQVGCRASTPRPARSTDAQGSWTVGWAPVTAMPVPCVAALRCCQAGALQLSIRSGFREEFRTSQQWWLIPDAASLRDALVPIKGRRSTSPLILIGSILLFCQALAHSPGALFG